MKRILLLLLCAGVMFGAFSACAKSGGEDCTAVSDSTEVSTDEAQIKDNEAIDLVKSFSNDELGLDDETAGKCSFLVQENGEVIDGDTVLKKVNDNYEKLER